MEACESCDIVVVGGGMAGVMAALAAKTPDNTVLIVEPSNVLGGQGTAGGVAGFCGDTERVNDFFAELIARLEEHGMIGPVAPHSDRREYDLEWCAFFLQEMVRERDIQVLLHSRVIGAECAAGVVGRLTIATAGGILRIAPRFVIDASGACVIPVLTGFPVVHEGANKQLPMSLYFTMWDTGRKVNAILPKGCPRWTNDQDIPMTSLHVFPTGKTEVKMKVVGFDAADGRCLSEAEMFARRQMHGLIYYLQTHGYKDVKLDTSVLASVSRMIGVREERRIVGEHVLTETEARSAAIFPDAVAVNNYHIDFHWPDRAQRAGTGVVDMLDPHHLPFGMLIPKGAKNLLVPGRGASGDQMAMSAFRVMAVVAQMGFAAGHAARQCVQTGRDLTTIDMKQLQRAIEAGGQSLDLSTYGKYLRRDIFSHGPFFEGDTGFRNCGPMAVALLDNGRFLAAWQGEADGRTGLWISERREKKWGRPRLAVTLAEPLPGDISLTRSGDGSLTLVFANGRLISEDEGVSWRTGGAARETPVPVPVGNVPGLLSDGGFGSARLDDGTLAVAFNPVISGRADFSKLRVALSMDDGATWPHCWDIANGSGKISHPALVPTRVGIGIVYLRDNCSPAFWHGSIERIIDGANFVETEPLA